VSTHSHLAEWQTLDRRLLVDRWPYARFLEEDVQLPTGQIIKNFVRVELPDFVIVFLVTPEGKVPFVQQFRQAVRHYTLELPAGHLDEGEEALIAAQRELREEAAMAAEAWQPLGKFVMDSNRHCGLAHLFLARGGHPTAEIDHGDLGELAVHWLTLEEVRRRWMGGEFICAPTSLCVGLALAALDAAK